MRDAESMAKGGGRLRTSRPAATRRPADVEALEERLRASLGTRVDLTPRRRGGRVVIHYYSDEELEGIIERLT